MMRALFSTLINQRNQLNQELLDLKHHLDQLEQTIQSFQAAMSNSQPTIGLILPEQEIARFHFIAKQQQLHNDCMLKKKTIQSNQAALSAQLIEINTQLKQLEKHQKRKQNLKQYQALTTQQKNNDEWVIQRGIKQ